MKPTPILELHDIVKSFGPTRALRGVSIDLYPGEIRGLIGENGSGKSTISSIVAGMQPCDSGTMILKGQPYQPKSPLDAQHSGVAMIVQEAGTILNISTAENIFAGQEDLFGKFGFVSRRKMVVAAKKALEAIGVDYINPGERINRLSFEDKKLVEVARAYKEDPDIFIVDETTTALSQRGRDIVYSLMRKLRDEGKCVIFISHDIDEMMEICDQLTILRDGEFIANISGEEMNPNNIKRLMVGREMGDHYYRDDWDGSYGEKVVLRAENVTGGFLIENLNMELHEREILGIGGLSDCGMHDLGKMLFGFYKAWGGRVVLGSGKEVRTITDAIDAGMGYVSKDRDKEALVLDASVGDNIALPGYKVFSPGPFISRKAEKAYVSRQIDALSIKCYAPEQKIDTLSGGNKQKVSFAKWLGKDSEILILDCPTRGVDIGVKAAMYDYIYQCKQEGKAVIIISEELPELIGMSDRILIMKDGKFTGEFRRSPDLTQEQIIHCMI